MAAAREQSKLKQLQKNPYQDVFITNNSDHIVGLEYGLLPDKPDMTPRTPAGGIARGAVLNALQKHGGKQ
jgi:hypothetical protein